MSIAFHQISKRFGSFVALDQVTLKVPTGKLLALLGPSGSGKTTLLRILGGLEVADTGTVTIDDDDVTSLTPQGRQAGFVFQHYALFRHMTVYENVAFGLRVRKRTSAEIKSKVMNLLELVGLGNLARRYPSELSGGQRQRVALARALAIEPKLLLLDEPFAALDAKVRAELRSWLRRLHHELHITTVFVTHDQEEAFEVADVVAILNHGKLQQFGTPDEVFETPANAFVLDFLGRVNVFHGRMHNGSIHVGDVALPVDQPDTARQSQQSMQGFNGSLDRPRESNGSAERLNANGVSAQVRSSPYGSATGYVRSHDFDVWRQHPSQPALRASVLQVAPIGASAKLTLLSENLSEPMLVEISRDRYLELKLSAGEEVFVAPRQWHVFHDEDYSI